MGKRNSSGGSATAGGMDFQHRVAAWVAVYILAEKDTSPPWDLPEGVTLEWLQCETGQPVDDLLVGTSGCGLVFAQIKRTLRLSGSEVSPLASALNQFVRQFIACRNIWSGSRPWERPLDPQKDRLVLITSPRSSKGVRVHLPDVLARLRNLSESQPLEDAAANDAQRRVLKVVRCHLEQAWQNLMGSQPSERDLRELLSLIRVHVADVETEGVDEQHAKNLLRQAVLTNPDQAGAAWDKLIELCSSFAARRSGADRPMLQSELLKAGIRLRAARSYRDDIERLRRHSKETLDALRHLSQIRVSETIKIERPCIRALRKAIEENSVLVVGEPGAGKSGALHDLVRLLKDEGRDCVFLAVDRIAARSLGELRHELRLEHELSEVLDNWPGTEPAFLVIDALDAARDEPTAKMIRELIRQVIEKGGRWRVVASIRKFDLRYSEELKGLFAGVFPTQFQDREFERIRHISIPRLSDEEMNQIESQCPELYQLIRDAPKQLHDLLRIPFNLRLAAELIGGGINPDQLTPITTQLELLDKYWSYCVIRNDGKGDAREAVLRKVCETMVQNRQLRVDRAEIASPDPGISQVINDLLSSQILVEWQSTPEALPKRYILAFAHHVLFDYAVARLLLRGDISDRLARDPDLVIAIRPSITLHFGYLWDADPNRREFWDAVFRVIREPNIPEIGKLIGPSVAAEMSKTLSDLEPLCDALENPNTEVREAAERAFRHLVGALQSGVTGDRPLIGYGAGPWCELLERVSRKFSSVVVAYSVRALLTTLCENPENFTSEQRVAAGQAARRLLEYAWSQKPRDGWLVIHALQSVCRTFESDPAASAALIRRCLEPSHLSQFGFEEIPWLAREVRRLIPLAPDLVEEIYRVAFSHQEVSEERTPIVPSLILPLVSNRRQDYQMGLYELAEVFPQFLEQAPEHATRALIAVLEAYVAQRHSPSSGKWHEERFDFNGLEAWLRTDYSAIWDEGDIYRHDEPLKMLDAFQQYLEKVAERLEDRELLRKLVQIVVTENRLAVLWRRLLLVGARFPETLGREILPLAWAKPVLRSIDTTTAAGEFIKAIYPTLDDESRRRIEEAILSLSESVPEDQHEAAEYLRNRILGCLKPEAIISEEARRLLEELQSRNKIPPNEPLVGPIEVSTLPYREEDYLKDCGVPVEDEPNRRVRELEQPVKEFVDKHLNSVPSLQEIEKIFPALQALHKALARADADGVHPKQRDYAWGVLADACALAARADGLSCEESPGAFVKDVLLEASRYPEPTPNPERDNQFDELPSWGGPSARIEAAAGLVTLARYAICAGPDVLEAIKRLSEDPVPAVRFRISQGIDALYRTAPELMWCIIERMCRDEPSRGVLRGLLVGPLQRLAGVEPDRVASLTKVVFERIKDGPGAEIVRRFCVSIFTSLYVWRNHPLCGQIVCDIASNPWDYPDETFHILSSLRESLTYGPTNPPDLNADAIRRRALDLLYQVLSSAQNSLREIKERHAGKPFNEWSQDDQDKFKLILRLIDGIAREVYFASGAYESKRQNQSRLEQKLKPEWERFYWEAGPILDELANVGYPSVAHYLLETLEFFIPLDPRGVLLRVGNIVRLAREWWYQYETMAVDLIVGLVKRYLADYRPLLRDDLDCRRMLVEVLDTFVQAGWPETQKFVYRLEEIFR